MQIVHIDARLLDVALERPLFLRNILYYGKGNTDL